MQVSGVSQSPDQTGGVGGHHHKHPPMSDEMMSAVAKKLDMSVDDLKSALGSGQSLRDIAKDKGVSDSDLRDTIHGAEGTGPHRPRGGDPGEMASKLAANLGINAQDLQAAFKSGDGLQTLLDKAGISEDQFHAAVAKTFSNPDSQQQGAVIDTAA